MKNKDRYITESRVLTKSNNAGTLELKGNQLIKVTSKDTFEGGFFTELGEVVSFWYTKN